MIIECNFGVNWTDIRKDYSTTSDLKNDSLENMATRKDRGCPLSVPESQCEGRTGSQNGVYMDADGIVQADMLDDAKAEACSAKLPASCLVDPVEALEDTIFIFR